MKSIKEMAGETINVVVPAAKNAGEYVCFVGKTAKDGFFEGKKRITDFFKYTDKKKLIFSIILTIAAVTATVLAVVKICGAISELKSKTNDEDIE